MFGKLNPFPPNEPPTPRPPRRGLVLVPEADEACMCVVYVVVYFPEWRSFVLLSELQGGEPTQVNHPHGLVGYSTRVPSGRLAQPAAVGLLLTLTWNTRLWERRLTVVGVFSALAFRLLPPHATH